MQTTIELLKWTHSGTEARQTRAGSKTRNVSREVETIRIGSDKTTDHKQEVEQEKTRGKMSPGQQPLHLLTVVPLILPPFTCQFSLVLLLLVAFDL